VKRQLLTSTQYFRIKTLWIALWVFEDLVGQEHVNFSFQGTG
jgi:hypothetical protein